MELKVLCQQPCSATWTGVAGAHKGGCAKGTVQDQCAPITLTVEQKMEDRNSPELVTCAESMVSIAGGLKLKGTPRRALHTIARQA